MSKICHCCKTNYYPWLGSEYCQTCYYTAEDIKNLGIAIKKFLFRTKAKHLEKQIIQTYEQSINFALFKETYLNADPLNLLATNKEKLKQLIQELTDLSLQ